MGTKQLLIIIFIACHQIALAGNGMPVKKQAGNGLKSGNCNQVSLFISFDVNGDILTSDQTGYKGQLRYYMKNTLNVLKKPLYASHMELNGDPDIQDSVQA